MFVGYISRDKGPNTLPDDCIGAHPASKVGTDSIVVYTAEMKHGMSPAGHQPQIPLMRGLC